MVRIEFVSPSFQLDQDLPFSGSAEMSKDIAEAAYGELEAYKKEIDSRYAKHRIEAVDDAEAVINDTGLESDQQGRRNTNIGMMNSVNDLQAKLDNFTMEVVKADAERVDGEILEVFHSIGVVEIAAEEHAVVVLNPFQLVLEVSCVQIEKHVFVTLEM